VVPGQDAGTGTRGWRLVPGQDPGQEEEQWREGRRLHVLQLPVVVGESGRSGGRCGQVSMGKSMNTNTSMGWTELTSGSSGAGRICTFGLMSLLICSSVGQDYHCG
jgi:hypothetical protein